MQCCMLAGHAWYAAQRPCCKTHMSNDSAVMPKAVAIARLQMLEVQSNLVRLHMMNDTWTTPAQTSVWVQQWEEATKFGIAIEMFAGIGSPKPKLDVDALAHTQACFAQPVQISIPLK